jgi:hypothetical protein
MRTQDLTIGTPDAPRTDHAGQDARREQFQRDHPDAEIAGQAGAWHGSLPVSGTRRETKARDLGTLLDCLERLAVMDAIERDFPDWHIWHSSIGRWWAVRQGRRARHDDPADLRPLTVDADDADSLRAALARTQDLATWVA